MNKMKEEGKTEN